MRVMNHNSSARKSLHLQSAAGTSRHTALSDGNVGQRLSLAARTQMPSRHFLLQAPQYPCSVRKRFNREETIVAKGGQNPVARL